MKKGLRNAIIAIIVVVVLVFLILSANYSMDVGYKIGYTKGYQYGWNDSLNQTSGYFFSSCVKWSCDVRNSENLTCDTRMDRDVVNNWCYSLLWREDYDKRIQEGAVFIINEEKELEAYGNVVK